VAMGVGSGGQGVPCPPPPWIFIHGTNIVDRGLKVLFFGLFLLFFGLFAVAPPPEKFSTDALGSRVPCALRKKIFLRPRQQKLNCRAESEK